MICKTKEASVRSSERAIRFMNNDWNSKEKTNNDYRNCDKTSFCEDHTGSKRKERIEGLKTSKRKEEWKDTEVQYASEFWSMNSSCFYSILLE